MQQYLDLDGQVKLLFFIFTQNFFFSFFLFYYTEWNVDIGKDLYTLNSLHNK